MLNMNRENLYIFLINTKADANAAVLLSQLKLQTASLAT